MKVRWNRVVGAFVLVPLTIWLLCGGFRHLVTTWLPLRSFPGNDSNIFFCSLALFAVVLFAVVKLSTHR